MAEIPNNPSADHKADAANRVEIVLAEMDCDDVTDYQQAGLRAVLTLLVEIRDLLKPTTPGS